MRRQKLIHSTVGFIIAAKLLFQLRVAAGDNFNQHLAQLQHKMTRRRNAA